MAIILHIETATNICSVALSDKEEVIGLKETGKTNAHSELLTLFVQDVLSEANISLAAVDAVCVSSGPGSYTGLRIGVSVAKGLCYALNKPLISVGTLAAMAYGAKEQSAGTPEVVWFCPMLDARRMEVYCALYNSMMEEIRPPIAKIIDAHSFADVPPNQPLLLFGNGMDKCRFLFENNPMIRFMDHYDVSAKNMVLPALAKFHARDFANVAYFEPYYLKDFIAGKPNVKGLK
ncbi:MAG TPA: tRNA (adenosine(37)-N6)-threonylcarbamoyltransferase complex dimerization subunit type 1 TsaB [Bacteroidales bacterium]|nr:tRNA (adenosine(37)-N6)-threonylcarbamoyltransferase complex dimerization subunit type 1 TsaB [Bacteroidales bacterium]HQI69833.1 tRNA (adenosine(37)-N6)-threonylcarbamoyltransferase complex dimerization subunit type 1 TsaB [Bacteroidales bacterium]